MTKLFTKEEVNKYCNSVVNSMSSKKDFRILVIDKKEYIIFTKKGFQKFVKLMIKKLLENKLLKK